MEALTAVGLLYHYPMAHYVLGVALQRLGRFRRAVDALEVAVTLNPNFRAAHRRLAGLYANRLGDPQKSAEHSRLAEACKQPARSGDIAVAAAVEPARPAETAAIEKPIAAGATNAPASSSPPREPIDPSQAVTIVTGLPRSGTSLMMKMLAAGGVPVVTDGQRAADEDNPEGYFEFEPVKKTPQDASWLDQAQGKAVKIIHLLVPQLPRQRRYRVIVMHRHPDEVLASQQKMLQRKQRAGGKLSDGDLKRVFERQMTTLDRLLTNHPCFDKIDVDYNRLLSDPGPEVERLAAWLGGNPAIDAMVTTINPALYRQRQGRPQRAIDP
jgi:hypothetical protein